MKNPFILPQTHFRRSLPLSGIMTSAIVVALLFAGTSSYAQGRLMNKLISKVAKKVGGANVVTTASLDDLQPTIGIGSNLYPVELGTISQSFFEDWKTGGDQVFLMFTKRNENTFLKIDGTVTIDGMPVEYVTSGMYSLITAANTSPRKVEITTSTGQKSSFTIAPMKSQVKLLSINGQTDNVALDLTKDVTLDIGGTVKEGTLLKISLAINQLAIKSIYDVCYVRSGSKLVIPAAAFRNINIAPAGDAVYGYKNSFLSVTVEETENATGIMGNIPSVQYTSSYSDGKFITVSTEPKLNTGLTARGKENLKDGEMEYNFVKPNAYTSRPVQQLKKIAVISFGLQGKTFVESSVITQEKDVLKGEAQTSKTTTITFPQQTDAAWDKVLETIYPQLTAIVQSELSTSLLPIDAAGKTEAYKSITTSTTTSFSLPDKNTKEEITKAYKGSKFLSDTRGYGSIELHEKLMQEAGADALMSLTLSFGLESEGEFGVLIPTLSFDIAGKANGRTTATKYYSGTVIGKGIKSEAIGLTVAYSSATGITGDTKGRNDSKTYHSVGTLTAEQLDAVLRRSDLVTVFGKALKEIHEKEKANGDYEVVWNLQK